jgi:hypothetical protein
MGDSPPPHCKEQGKIMKRQSAQKKRNKRYHNHSQCIPINYSALNTGNSLSTPWFWKVGHGFYQDWTFHCRDCGKAQVWKAENQQWWYEEMQGFIHTTAVRCRACRIRERERKAEVRRVSEEGKRRKLARQNSFQPRRETAHHL